MNGQDDDNRDLTPFQRKRKEWLQRDLAATESELHRLSRDKTWPSGIPIADPSELTAEVARLRKMIKRIGEQLEKLR